MLNENENYFIDTFKNYGKRLGIAVLRQTNIFHEQPENEDRRKDLLNRFSAVIADATHAETKFKIDQHPFDIIKNHKYGYNPDHVIATRGFRSMLQNDNVLPIENQKHSFNDLTRTPKYKEEESEDIYKNHFHKHTMEGFKEGVYGREHIKEKEKKAEGIGVWWGKEKGFRDPEKFFTDLSNGLKAGKLPESVTKKFGYSQHHLLYHFEKDVYSENLANSERANLISLKKPFVVPTTDEVVDHLMTHFKKGYYKMRKKPKKPVINESTTQRNDLEHYMFKFGKSTGKYAVLDTSFCLNDEKTRNKLESMVLHHCHSECRRYINNDEFTKDELTKYKEFVNSKPYIVPHFFVDNGWMRNFMDDIRETIHYDTPKTYKEYEKEDIFHEIWPHFVAGFKEETTPQKRREETEKKAIDSGSWTRNRLKDAAPEYEKAMTKQEEQDLVDHIHNHDHTSADHLRKFFDDKKIGYNDKDLSRMSKTLHNYHSRNHFDKPEFHNDLSHLTPEELKQHYKKHFMDGFKIQL